MPHIPRWALAGTLAASLSAVAAGQVLWKAPPDLTVADWVGGPGGAESAPRPPFQFVKENLDGTNPKIDVVDAAGKEWVVKFGGEVHSDVLAARLLYAVGYASEPTYFVPCGVIENVHGLKRAKYFVSKSGLFRNARFKLREHHKRSWSWVENPFQSSRELGGLKIMMMLLSNWDAKDARDGKGSNTGVYEGSRGDPSSAWFAVTDWGATFGKSGGFFRRARWDWDGYRADTPKFVTLHTDGSIAWGFRGKHFRDITAGVGAVDVRWLAPYLSRISDEDLAAGLMASGASDQAVLEFTQAIRRRIAALQHIAKTSDILETEAR
jgi:hypothetical protein